VLANGVYAYKSRAPRAAGKTPRAVARRLNEYIAADAPPEHYRPGTKLGRFFCAALLDVASSEAGILATVERCQDARVLMGRKPYALLNYAWEDGAKVEQFVNKSLCYGIFASTSTNFFSGVQYETHPNGYLRDKKLLDWYVPLVRMLSEAGWQPVRYAAVEPQDVSCERFGSGRTYFTLYNDSERKTTCKLTLDLKSLNLDPQNVVFSEIGRNTPVTQLAPGAAALELEPKRTYVIQPAASNR
jgi:hypothetical protein